MVLTCLAYATTDHSPPHNSGCSSSLHQQSHSSHILSSAACTKNHQLLNGKYYMAFLTHAQLHTQHSTAVRSSTHSEVYN